MFNFRKRQSLKNYLTENKYVKIKGFEFLITKINVMNYLDGSKVLLQSYQTYTEARAKEKMSEEISINKKLWDHYTDVICAGVVVPKITRQPTDDPKEVHIELLFHDMELVNKLYEEIIQQTYGKKKVARSLSPKIALGT